MIRHNPNERHIGPVLAELAAIVASRPASPFIAPGARRMVAGREYVAVAVEPYQARSGESQLVTWCGHCATCGASFEARASRNPVSLPINCLEHRGRRTRHGKRRRGLRLAIERAIAEIDAGDVARARKLLAGQLRWPA